MKITFFLATLIISVHSHCHESLVDSYLSETENCRQLSPWFYFCGTEKQLNRVVNWINEIKTYTIGSETMNAIESSQKKILIMHKKSAINSAGKTLAQASSNLANGVGVEVVVQMNFNMPESGTHLVASKKHDLIPFTALQNFFHEMSHARHKTNGTFWMSAGEKQAINDENIFREEEALRKGDEIKLRSSRGYGHKDQQIWYGEKRITSTRCHH